MELRLSFVCPLQVTDQVLEGGVDGLGEVGVLSWKSATNWQQGSDRGEN